MKNHLFLILNILLLATVLFGSDPRSPEWPEIRKAHLIKEPACALCGMIRKDISVHHKYPFHLYPQYELCDENLISLCTSKNWGFSCHLLAGHGGNFKYFNPWILEDIDKLKVIGNPKYIELHGSEEFEKYIKMMKARVKKFNTLSVDEMTNESFNILKIDFNELKN